jgi:hypothetical protein
VRTNEPAGERRTGTLDGIAARMQAAAATAEFDPAEVANWFEDGTDELRIVALNVMLAREDCRDLVTALAAGEQPRSPFERYYGLLLAEAMAPSLDPLERRLVFDAVTRARRRRRVRRDAPLDALAGRVLVGVG